MKHRYLDTAPLPCGIRESAQHIWFSCPPIQESGRLDNTHSSYKPRAAPELAVSHYTITGASEVEFVLSKAEMISKKVRTGTRERNSDAICLFARRKRQMK
jgi:hypothetical protein